MFKKKPGHKNRKVPLTSSSPAAKSSSSASLSRDDSPPDEDDEAEDVPESASPSFSSNLKNWSHYVTKCNTRKMAMRI